MEKIIKAFMYLSISSAFFPFILYVYQKKFKFITINIFACLLAAAVVSEIMIYIFAMQKKSVVVVANSFFIAQFVLVSIIYFHLYMKKPGAYLKVLTALGIVIILVNWIFWQDITTIQNYTWASTSILIAAMAFGHFSHLAKFPVENVKRYAPYWISTGLLFYCCLSFVILAFSRVFVERLNVIDSQLLWMFQNINNIFKNICFCIAIWWATHHDSPLMKPKSHNN